MYSLGKYYLGTLTGVLLLAIGLMGAEYLSPGVFAHDHSSVAQGGATLSPSTFSGTTCSGTQCVGTSTLKTATGSANWSTSNGSCTDVVLNDYAFYPNFAGGGASLANYVEPSGAGRTDTTGTWRECNQSGGTISGTAYWRYMTATDNPRVWVIADATGVIQGVWASDDPVPGDGPALIIQTCAGCVTYKYSPADLIGLVPATAAATVALAKDWILARGYGIQHLPYRTLAMLAASITALPVRDLPAPATWIHANARINPVTGHLCPQAQPAC